MSMAFQQPQVQMDNHQHSGQLLELNLPIIIQNNLVKKMKLFLSIEMNKILDFSGIMIILMGSQGSTYMQA